ncbi:MAG: hypothetical protein JWN75_651 [Candidatus Saccharibacteria bacterium]|nr:hypothetical protein [Candidatus Saccharibacteria bacterium]
MVSSTATRSNQAGSDVQFELFERTWDMLQDTIYEYGWPNGLQKEAKRYLRVLINPSEEGTALANHVAIANAAERLNSKEGFCFQRRNRHVGRSIRERVAAATYVMRSKLRGIDMPLLHEIWYEDYRQQAQDGCRRTNPYDR